MTQVMTQTIPQAHHPLWSNRVLALAIRWMWALLALALTVEYTTLAATSPH